MAPSDSLSRPCPGCGYGNEPAARFCAQCGTPLRATSSIPAPPAEFGGQYRVRGWDGESGQEAPPGWQVSPGSPFGPRPHEPSQIEIPPPAVYARPEPGPRERRPAGSRRPGIEFVPYTSQTASKLQSTGAARAWLVPTIAVLAAIALLLLGVMIALFG